MLITLLKTKFPRDGYDEHREPIKSWYSDAHGPLPTPVVTGNTEDNSAGRTKEDDEGDRRGHDGGFGNVVEIDEGSYKQGKWTG